MIHEYEVKRKLQEQSGSYFVILPKLWVKSSGLKEVDLIGVKFNGMVKISASKRDEIGMARSSTKWLPTSNHLLSVTNS